MHQPRKRPSKRKLDTEGAPESKRMTGGILGQLLPPRQAPEWAKGTTRVDDASSDGEDFPAFGTAGGIIDDVSLLAHNLEVIPLPDPNIGHRHRSTIASVAFSPDPLHPLLLTASPDRVVAVYDLHLDHYAALTAAARRTSASRRQITSKTAVATAAAVSASRRPPIRSWVLKDCPVLNALFIPTESRTTSSAFTASRRTPAHPEDVAVASYHTATTAHDTAAADGWDEVETSAAAAASGAARDRGATAAPPARIIAGGQSPLLYSLDVESGAATVSDTLCVHFASRRHVKAATPLAASGPLANVRGGMIATAAGRDGSVQLLHCDTLRVVTELHVPGIAAGVRVCFDDAASDASSHHVYVAAQSTVYLYDIRRPSSAVVEASMSVSDAIRSRGISAGVGARGGAGAGGVGAVGGGSGVGPSSGRSKLLESTLQRAQDTLKLKQQLSAQETGTGTGSKKKGKLRKMSHHDNDDGKKAAGGDDFDGDDVHVHVHVFEDADDAAADAADRFVARSSASHLAQLALASQTAAPLLSFDDDVDAVVIGRGGGGGRSSALIGGGMYASGMYGSGGGGGLLGGVFGSGDLPRLLSTSTTDSLLTATAVAVGGGRLSLGGRNGEVVVFPVNGSANTNTNNNNNNNASSLGSHGSHGVIRNLLGPPHVFLNLRTHIDTVTFHPSGEVVAAASSSAPDALRFFHIPSMTAFANFPSRDQIATKVGSVRSVAFSPGGGYVAMGTGGGRARIFRLPHWDSY